MPQPRRPEPRLPVSLLGAWSQDALAAGVTDQALSLGDTNVGTAGSGIVVPLPGQVRYLTIHGNARTAGAATFTLWLNGVTTTLSGAIDATNTSQLVVVATSGQVIFAAGDFIDPRVTTTGAWAAGNADYNVCAWGELVLA